MGRDLTWGGDHTIQCTNGVLQYCTPETCIILLTSVKINPNKFHEKDKKIKKCSDCCLRYKSLRRWSKEQVVCFGFTNKALWSIHLICILRYLVTEKSHAKLFEFNLTLNTISKNEINISLTQERFGVNKVRVKVLSFSCNFSPAFTTF